MSHPPIPLSGPQSHPDLAGDLSSANFRPRMREFSAYARVLVTIGVLVCALRFPHYPVNKEAVVYVGLAAMIVAALSYFWSGPRWGAGTPSGNRALSFVAIAADIGLVTTLVYFTGGTQSPFYAIYFPIIIFASIFYTASEAFVITGLLSAWYLTVLLLAGDTPALALKVGLTHLPLFLLTAWFSGVVSAELERRRQRQEITTQHFRTIAEIGQAALSTLEIGPLLEPMLQRALSLVSSSAGAILLANDEGELASATCLGVTEQALRENPASSEAILQAFRERQAVSLESDHGSLAMPLTGEDRVFGVLFVAEPGMGELSKDDAPMLDAAANQIAMAIQNSAKHEAAVRAHRRESLLLRMVGSVSVAQDLRLLLQSLVDATAGGLSARSAMLTLKSDREDELTVEAVSGELSNNPNLPKTLYARAGIHGQAIVRGEPVLLARASTDTVSDVLLERLGVQSALAAPIRVDDKIIGAISVHDKAAEQDFNREDQDLLGAIANRAAVVIQNARLYEQANLRVRELQALYRLAESVVRCQQLPSTFELAASSVAETLSARAASLWIQDASRDALRCAATTNPDASKFGETFDLAEFDEARRLVNQPQRFAEAVPKRLAHALGVHPDSRSLICAPLKIEGEPLGLLCVEAEQPYAFSDDDLRLASMFADQLAMAAQRDQLNRTMQRNADEIRALFEAVETMSATNAIDEILEFVTRRVRMLFPCDWCAVRLMRGDTEELGLAAAQGAADAGVHGCQGDVVAASDCWAVRKDKPFLVEDVGEDFHCRAIHGDSLARSYLCVPLTAGGKTIGVLQMTADRPHAFTGEHQQLFMALADQAAIAVQRAKLHEEVERLAVRDGLTGLYNYSYFHEQLAQELTRSKRSSEPMSLIILDIDHFKGFNDTYGHPTGDTLLKRLGEVMQEAVRAVDLCARMGGEEFAIMLPNTEKAGARKVAEKLRRVIEETPFFGDTAHPVVRLTVSIGVASAPEDAENKDQLVRRADSALYRAKAEGRNRVAAA